MTVPGAGLAGRRVLVTGHTGFVGSWLVLALSQIGAEVTGLAGPAMTGGLYERAGLRQLLAASVEGDIRDLATVDDAVRRHRPELVFHLAALATVPESYRDPVGTFATNVMGTAHVLDAARRSPTASACLVATSDKCYSPADKPHPEGDRLGGDDPYSASKGAAELVVRAYARSYPTGPALATTRAGNIIGGGDATVGRIVPDFASAAAARRPLQLRRPDAVRPWQHVCDCVAGYLLLADRLLQDPARGTGPWNLGSDPGEALTVRALVDALGDEWSTLEGEPLPSPEVVPSGDAETGVLLLDSSRARRMLSWRPASTAQGAARLAARWYWNAWHTTGFDALDYSLREMAGFQTRQQPQGASR
ncbi:MAG TPA: CDP-glucose 4,6-dehydratase [Acidimicrobiales bacterium]|nr:CDP-glucose 4,6-dehydratase [Acidimicrobiales bacterium]